MTPVAGVDGCRAGWLAVRLGPDGATARIVETAALASLAPVVGIDMPIGLEDTRSAEGRPVDRAARAFLAAHAPPGLRAGSRVFPAPCREMLGLLDLGYHAANARLPMGRRFSQQSFNIAGRIRDLDRALAPDGPVHEVHPEVSFAALAGRTLPPKKRQEGRAIRLELLAKAGFAPERLALGLGPRTGRWGWDDLLDACAAAWSAARIAGGQHGTLPDPPQRDARGHRMTIHY